MAIVSSALGKMNGRVGNLSIYERDGVIIIRTSTKFRPTKNEAQKSRAAVFGTVSHLSKRLRPAIVAGFPGSREMPKGTRGFIKANATGVVAVGKKHPSAELTKRKDAMQEFVCKVDYRRLRMAAGELTMPDVTAVVDISEGGIRFTHQGVPLDSIDCLRNDLILGVVVDTDSLKCQTVELGRRGDDFVRIFMPDQDIPLSRAAVYAFATSADNKQASDSTCLIAPEEN